MNLCATPPLVVSGNPDASRLVQIMKDPDRSQRMPRGPGNVIDTEGVKLVEAWARVTMACP